MNRELYRELFNKYKAFKALKRKNRMLTKDQKKEILSLIQKVGNNFPINTHLIDYGKHHNLSRFATLRRDVLINELWKLLGIEYIQSFIWHLILRLRASP
jgi:hypothetical protein